MTPLTGKTVLVTGAGGRIGRAIVAELGLWGARVACVDLPDNLPDATPADAVLVAADVSDAAEVSAAFDATESALGPVDAVICAHGLSPNTPILDMTTALWDRVFEVNTRSVMVVTQAAFQRWIARSSPGSIVLIGSIAGHSARAGSAHYASSKAAIEMFTEVAAIEGGPHGIRVNAVAPSLILDDVVRAGDDDIPEYFAKSLDAMPLRRTGTPREVARACLFLVTDYASYITGSILDVSGGAHAGRPQMPFTGDIQ